MMFRLSLLLGLGLLMAGTASTSAQQRRPASREDLLDELTRHIQICAEINDTQQRLSCYDKLQTQVGGVQAPPPMPPQPTPLANNPPTNAPPPPAFSGSMGGGSVSGQQLAPPPLNVPGGGVATLGGQGSGPPPGADDGSRPQPQITRTGPRPVPYSSQPMPLVTLRAYDLTYGASRYWQVSIAVISNTSRNVDTQIQCTFTNGGRSVGDANFGPISIAPGEQITTQLTGPPTSTYVDSTNCRVLSP
jgi:hypothetical protein